MKEEASVKVLASKVGLANLLFFGGEKIIIIWKKIFPTKAKECVSTGQNLMQMAEKERVQKARAQLEHLSQKANQPPFHHHHHRIVLNGKPGDFDK